jgi:hypothetical protein
MSMKIRCALLALFMGFASGASAWAQVTTGTVTGNVKDAQGGVVPGATVILVSQARGTESTPALTSGEGEFVFPNVVPDTYTVRVEMPSFKTLNRTGVIVSAGERVAVGSLVIEVGSASETVDVTAEAPLIQASSGERSFTLNTEAVQNLPIANRGYTALAALAPGVVATQGFNGLNIQRTGGGGQTNFTMDGVSTMDTGGNSVLLQMNVESIAEVKVVASNYQAEYGRSSGLQIAAVTKSGSNRFHGSLYDVERNSDWNSNSKTNILNGDPKPVLRERDWGYSIGGPVGRPGGNNKLFFFYSHEFAPRTSGNNVVRYRMPTELERRGDFSQTYDNNGNLYPYIKDPLVSGTCSASNQSACFQDGGVVGRIPANRLYAPGLAVLNMWPSPNTNGAGLAYNYELTRPSEKALAWQPAVRVDYQPLSSLRASFKYSGWAQRNQTFNGSIPGFNDTKMYRPVVYTMAATVNYTITPTTFLEVIYGRSQNELTGCGLAQGGTGPSFCQNALAVNPVSNRETAGMADLPFLYPDATVIDPEYYAFKQFNAVQPAYWDGTRILKAPNFAWGSRVANTPPNVPFPGFLNTNRTQDVSISLTKLAGRHTIKAGFYNNHSYKAENAGTGSLGTLNFGNAAGNALDTTFGYSNAAIGVFSSYQQNSKYVEGAYTYDNTEGYLQDNWRVTERLTLDYGVRFVHQTPQWDSRMQASNFLPDQWSGTAAPQLYAAGCANGAVACSGPTRQALNPITGELLGPASSVFIGQLVPNSGDTLNGIFAAGQGISKETYSFPALAAAPRFGAAWDLSGNQQLVVRGGAGLFFDRPTNFQLTVNPPTQYNVTVNNSTLQSLSTAQRVEGPPTLLVYQQNAKLPSSVQWNAGVQVALPWAVTLDTSYVGQHAYNQLVSSLGGQGVNINAVDFGAAFLPSSQDPTLGSSATPGATAVSANQLRAFRGYGRIGQFQHIAWRTYHSIQLSLQRRFSNGVSFGIADTIGLSDMSSTAPRLDHLADGTYTVRADQAEADALLGDNAPQTHTIRANFVWDLPDLRADGRAMRALSYVVNDWQLSGVWSATTGTAYTVGFSYQNGTNNLNLTGSPDYAARIRLEGDPGTGCSGDLYRQFNAAAFQGPLSNSTGLESGTDYVRGCFQSVLDLSIARNIGLGGGRALQFRLDMFNAPNSAIVTSRAATANYASLADPVTITNLPYDSAGNLIPARSTPRGAGFGVANGFQTPRALQAQIRFSF